MTIKEFIEKAIEGGWYRGYTLSVAEINGKIEGVLLDPDGDAMVAKTTHEILLDPLAWQAVGKVEGWGEAHPSDEEIHTLKGMVNPLGRLGGYKERMANKMLLKPKKEIISGWLYHMHRMIDALAEGKSVEQFLQDLTD